MALSGNQGVSHFGEPSSQNRPVTPSDTTVLNPPARGLYIGGGGDVTLLGPDDTVATLFTAVPQGAVLPARAVKVMETGTTASSIVAMS